MKKLLLGLETFCLILAVTATGAAHAADSKDPNQDALDAIDAAFAKQDKAAGDWLDANGVSPTFHKTGIGVGTGIGHTTASGTQANATATFRTRMFSEGTEDDISNAGVPSIQDARNWADGDAVTAINNRIAKEYEQGSPKNPIKTLKDGTKQATYGEEDIRGFQSQAVAAARASLDARLDARNKEYGVLHDEIDARTKAHGNGASPLYLVEGAGQYNMIGKSANDGAYTGIAGNLRLGIGFSFKDYGKNGCNIYFLATGNAEAQGYYKLQDANSARVAVGAEQGFLCQIANTVTIMASPSVQAGKFAHSDAADNTEAKTDWLNYAARIRAIVNNRLYISAESVLHPSMKKAAEPGAHWEASENTVSVDYALPHSEWVAGADLKFVQFHDENAGATGNHDVNDNSFGLSFTRAF